MSETINQTRKTKKERKKIQKAAAASAWRRKVKEKKRKKQRNRKRERILAVWRMHAAVVCAVCVWFGQFPFAGGIHCCSVVAVHVCGCERFVCSFLFCFLPDGATASLAG